MNKIDPFNMFITKYIIPLAYDESLSYYEQLIRISDVLNDVIKNQNGITHDIILLVTTIVNKALEDGEILLETVYDDEEKSLKFIYGKAVI